MSALILKQIERGSYSIQATDATVTITLSTTLTDTTKAVLLFTAKVDSIQPATFCWLGRILSTTQIQFERNVADKTGAIEWQVIEFTQGITVQHFYFTQSATTVDTAITAVTLAKAFVIRTTAGSGAGWTTKHFVKATLSSTTNLQTIVNTSTGALVAAQVIEIDDASVQVITDTMGTGATKDVTVTSITENKTFWFFSATTVEVTGVDDAVYLSYVNSTTLRFTRVNAAGIDFPFVLFVVSLSSGVTVQNVSTVIAVSSKTISPTIPNAVVVANTAINVNGFDQRMSSVNDTGDEARKSAIALSGLTTTAFTASRTESSTVSATTNVQVLEFSTSTTSFFWIMD